MSEATKLIPSIQALLTLPVISADVELFTSIYKLLMLLTSTHQGKFKTDFFFWKKDIKE